MTSTERDDVDELDVIVRVVGSSSRGNVEVAAATCRRYPSKQLSMNKDVKETTVKYGIHVYQFLDDERFSTLDSLLLQLGTKSVLLFECPPPLQRYFENVLSSHNIDHTAVGRTNLAFDVLAFLKTRARGDFLQIEKERKLALPLVTALLDVHVWRFDLPSYVDLEVVVGTPNQYMCLDSAAAEAVNLLPSPGQVAVGSLYGLFARHCKTKLGPKTLERWLRQPLLDVDAINTRLNVVESLVGNARLRSLLRDTGLKSVPDVLPVLHKFQKGTAGLAEIFKLYLFSRSIASLATVLNDESNTDSTATTTLQDEFSASFAQLQSSLALFDALVEHVVDLSQLPDLRVKADHDEALSELQEEDDALQTQANDWFGVLRDTLIGGRDTTSLADGVRLESSTQHGLVFRSTKGEDERLLRDTSLLDRSTGRRERLRILTILKNGVYFTTDTLASLGERLLQLKKEYADRQADIVTAAMGTAASYLPVFETASTLVASLDVLQAFACQAAESATSYARPTLLPLDRAASSDVRFDVVQARHPCVELVALQRFIPNDVALSLSPTTTSTAASSPASVTVITGPNTGGKSTYIRTAGVMAVLAQVGAYLPCQSATISIVDRLFCRVGAGDVQQRQTSTFLLEMLETSRMLSFATRHSLLIIDELGRGTSTADGFGLACAIARYIATQLQCRCLFATHFHELTRLSICKNLHVSAVVEQQAAGSTEAVTMTYEVRPGACQQSFGVHVAAMTDFPAPVLHEAKRKLISLESTADGAPTTTTTNGRDEVAHKRLRTVEENFATLHTLLPAEPTAAASSTLPKQLKAAFPRSLVDFAM